MQVSAINLKEGNGYHIQNNININRRNEQIGDTSFNSLTPYNTKKVTPADKLPIVFDSINQWKNFCHQRIVGKKLDVIA